MPLAAAFGAAVDSSNQSSDRKAVKPGAIFYVGAVLVGAFVIGAIFTPPDVISQFMLAVPLYLLYESGILVAVVLGKSDIRERSAVSRSIDEKDA